MKKDIKEICKIKAYLLTYDGVTKFLGKVEYKPKDNSTNDVIKALEEYGKDAFPDFQKVWLE